MSRLDPLLTSALEALSRLAVEETAESQRWHRIANRAANDEAATAANARGIHHGAIAAGCATMRIRLVSGEATVMEAEAWIVGCETTRPNTAKEPTR